MIDLISLRKLDDVSKKEIEQIIDLHEDLRMIIAKEINWFELNPKDPATYETLIEKTRKENFPNGYKKIAVIRKMKEENCKEEN